MSCLLGLATLWPLHHKYEVPQQFQVEVGLYMPTCFQLFPDPFFLHFSSQFISFWLFILPHNPIRWEHKQREVALSLKESLNIFALFSSLFLIQDFLWVSPVIECCFCVNNLYVKDTHPIRGPESKNSRIPKEVSFNLAFLRIGIPPCAPYMFIPLLSGMSFLFFRDIMYFGLFGYYIWGVHRPSHIFPILVQDIITDT